MKVRSDFSTGHGGQILPENLENLYTSIEFAKQAADNLLAESPTAVIGKIVFPNQEPNRQVVLSIEDEGEEFKCKARRLNFQDEKWVDAGVDNTNMATVMHSKRIRYLAIAIFSLWDSKGEEWIPISRYIINKFDIKELDTYPYIWKQSIKEHIADLSMNVLELLAPNFIQELFLQYSESINIFTEPLLEDIKLFAVVEKEGDFNNIISCNREMFEIVETRENGEWKKVA